jgi:hypothetical protein
MMEILSGKIMVSPYRILCHGALGEKKKGPL